MKRIVIVLALVMAGMASRADDFQLKNGETFKATVMGIVDEDVYMLKLEDGTTRRVKTGEVLRRIESAVAHAPVRVRPTVAVAATPPTATARERAIRAMLVAGSSRDDSLMTFVPLRAEGGQYAMSARPQAIDLKTAPILDRPAYEVEHVYLTKDHPASVALKPRTDGLTYSGVGMGPISVEMSPAPTPGDKVRLIVVLLGDHAGGNAFLAAVGRHDPFTGPGAPLSAHLLRCLVPEDPKAPK